MKYSVELEFIYSKKVEVEANNKEEAESLALQDTDIEEQYSTYHDCHITALEESNNE